MSETNIEQERAVFKLNENEYYTDSISDEAKVYIQNIQLIDSEINKHQLTLDIAKIAKDSVIAKLEELQKDFEAVPQEVAEVEKSA